MIFVIRQTGQLLWDFELRNIHAKSYIREKILQRDNEQD